MKQRSIAVISDIHIGPAARSQDLLPPGAPTVGVRNEKFLCQFERFVRAKGITADFLVIAGDLSSKALPDEFVHASSVMNTVAEALGVPNDKVMYTPGNHDVDWQVLKLASGATSSAALNLRWNQRYDPIKETSNLFVDRTGIAAPNCFTGSLFSAPYAGYWKHEDAIFVAVTSAAHDRPDEEIHHGFIRQETVDWLCSNTPERSSPNELRCLILHHHLVPHGNLGDHAKDFSTCQNADVLLTALRKLDFDIVFHGHKHYPRFQTELISSDHPVLVLGAGSFCADLEGYGGSVQNQFHLLSIEGRSPEGRVFGELRNWAYVHPSGWAENKKVYTVVDHQIGFGGPLQWRELVALLHPAIKAMSASRPMFCLDELPDSNRQLRYVSPETARKAVDEIAKIENLDVRWTDEPTVTAFLRRKTT